MKSFCYWIVASLVLLVFSVSCAALEQEPLRPEWLAEDYKSIELISQLASPAPLTIQAIRDILQIGDSGDEDDLGFGAIMFEFRKGNGYTALYVEGFVFKGAIGFYKLEIQSSPESWPKIRKHIINLWQHNNGPNFIECETGVVHTQTNEAVVSSYKSAVSAELGEMRRLECPNGLKEAYEKLTSPIETRAYGTTEGEMAIGALVDAKRIDLVENVLRGFSPSGRVLAAVALLKTSRINQMPLSRRYY